MQQQWKPQDDWEEQDYSGFAEDDIETAEEKAAFAQMTEKQIDDYWEANHSYPKMKAYLADPKTPQVAKDLLDLNTWAEHRESSNNDD